MKSRIIKSTFKKSHTTDSVIWLLTMSINHDYFEFGRNVRNLKFISSKTKSSGINGTLIPFSPLFLTTNINGNFLSFGKASLRIASQSSWGSKSVSPSKNNSTWFLNNRFSIFCKDKSENFLRYHSIASSSFNWHWTTSCFRFGRLSVLEDETFFRISTSSNPFFSRTEITGPTFRWPTRLSAIITW